MTATGPFVHATGTGPVSSTGGHLIRAEWSNAMEGVFVIWQLLLTVALTLRLPVVVPAPARLTNPSTTMPKRVVTVTNLRRMKSSLSLTLSMNRSTFLSHLAPPFWYWG